MVPILNTDELHYNTSFIKHTVITKYIQEESFAAFTYKTHAKYHKYKIILNTIKTNKSLIKTDHQRS